MEARARAEAHVEKLRTHWSHPGGSFTLASYVVPPPTVQHVGALDGVFAGLFRDAYLESLFAGIDATYQPGERTVSTDERARLLAELEAKRRNLEALEELAIRRMRAAGVSVPRRPQADPETVVMLEDEGTTAT